MDRSKLAKILIKRASTKSTLLKIARNRLLTKMSAEDVNSYLYAAYPLAGALGGAAISEHGTKGVGAVAGAAGGLGALAGNQLAEFGAGTDRISPLARAAGTVGGGLMGYLLTRSALDNFIKKKKDNDKKNNDISLSDLGLKDTLSKSFSQQTNNFYGSDDMLRRSIRNW